MSLLARPDMSPFVAGSVEQIAGKAAMRLEQKGYGSFASRHEVLGVVTEEFHELVEAVRSDPMESVRQELLDVAVACLFGIASIEAGMDW